MSVKDLTVVLDNGRPVIEGISLSLAAGEAIGLVGESGSGKTTTALALFGFAREGLRIARGEVEIAGERMALDDEKTAKRLRGRLISHVPQDPSTSLNPSLRIGKAIGDVVSAHRSGSANERMVFEALERVCLPRSPQFVNRFPHQLSGGQQQRVL